MLSLRPTTRAKDFSPVATYSSKYRSVAAAPAIVPPSRVLAFFPQMTPLNSANDATQINRGISNHRVLSESGQSGPSGCGCAVGVVASTAESEEADVIHWIVRSASSKRSDGQASEEGLRVLAIFHFFSVRESSSAANLSSGSFSFSSKAALYASKPILRSSSGGH